jgi:polar amino acid transport system substrate-binding protein
MTARFRRFAVVIAACVAAAMLLAACGSSDSTTSSSTPKVTATTPSGSTIALPAKYKGKTIVVATDASYAPSESFDKDGKTIIGFDVDLANAIGKQLGVPVDVKNASFDGIIPGLAAGKYGIGMSSFTDNKEREKTVDFVTYFTAGSSFYVKAQGGPTINTVADLCGHTVAVEKGTVQADDAAAQAKKCKMTVSVFPDQNGANLALQSGRADVAMADSPVAAYAVKQSNGQFKLSGSSYDDAPYGIAIPKNSGLAVPIQKAVQALIDNGQYKQILDKWGVEAGAIPTAQVNAATS